MIIRRASRPSFTVIDNRALDDERLSYKALGLLAFVLRQPDTWETNYRHLAGRHSDGEHAVRSALKELEQHGYIERRRERGEDGKFQWVQFIYEVPRSDHAGVFTPDAGNASAGNASAGNAMRETAPVVSNEVATTDAATTDEQSEPTPSTSLARLDEWADDLPAVVAKSGLVDDARELCGLLETTLTERGYRNSIGKARSKKWLLDMEALLRIDERPVAQVRWVVNWLHRGEDRVALFWRTNVRSPDKLRVQWDVMREQYRALGLHAKTRQQRAEDDHARAVGLDPDESRAHADQLVRSMFGPGDETHSALTSDAVIDVESRGA